MKILTNYNPYIYTHNQYPNISLKTNKMVSNRATCSFKSRQINIHSIKGQENCWKLHMPDIFEQFIKSDQSLLNTINPFLEMIRSYNLNPSIDLFFMFRNANLDYNLNEFFNLMKSKYGIDLEIPPKVYRFVGEREVSALIKGEKIEPQRDGYKRFDVTINPELNWNKYRITFKPKQKYSILDEKSAMRENRGSGHDYFYYLYDSYSIDDVEKIDEVY